MHAIRNVGVVDLGTLETQIAIQRAAYGYDVSGFDPDPQAFDKMQTKVRSAMHMVRRVPHFPDSEWEVHAKKVRGCNDLAQSVGDAKRGVFALLDDLAPPPCVAGNQ